MDGNDLTLEDVFAEIDALNVAALQAGEFSVGMYARDRGITYNAADRMIANAVKANLLLEVGERLVNGHRAMCYRRK